LFCSTLLCFIGQIIDSIKYDVSQLFGVETGERDLVVSATSFKNDAVTIDIEAHLKTTQAMKEGELKTAVIATIAKCIQKTFVKSSDEKSNSRVPAN
jgi:hypothetical protein